FLPNEGEHVLFCLAQPCWIAQQEPDQVSRGLHWLFKRRSRTGFRLLPLFMLLKRSGSNGADLHQRLLHSSGLGDTALSQLPSLGLQPACHHFVAAQEALLAHVSPQLAGIGWALGQTLLKVGDIGIEDAFAPKSSRPFGKGPSSDKLA